MPLVFEDNKTKQSLSLQSVSSVITAGVVSSTLPSCQHLKCLAEKDKEKKWVIFTLSQLDKESKIHPAVPTFQWAHRTKCYSYFWYWSSRNQVWIEERKASATEQCWNQLFCQGSTCTTKCSFALMRTPCMHHSYSHCLCLAFPRMYKFYTFLVCLSVFHEEFNEHI